LSDFLATDTVGKGHEQKRKDRKKGLPISPKQPTAMEARHNRMRGSRRVVFVVAKIWNNEWLDRQPE